MWDVNTHKCLATLVGHSGAVRALAASDTIVFSGSDDTTIRVGGLQLVWVVGWLGRLQRGSCLPHAASCQCKPARPIGLQLQLKPASSPLAQAWDANTLTCLRTLEGHEDNVRVLAVGHNRLFSGSWDKTVRVRAQGPAALLAGSMFVATPAAWWRSLCCPAAPPGPLPFSFPPKTLPLSMLPLPPGPCGPQVWSCETLTCIKVLEGHNEAVLALAVGDLFMASGSYDTTIRFWDLASWHCVRKAEGHNDAVRVLAAAEGGRVISGAYDGAVGVW